MAQDYRRVLVVNLRRCNASMIVSHTNSVRVRLMRIDALTGFPILLIEQLIDASSLTEVTFDSLMR